MHYIAAVNMIIIFVLVILLFINYKKNIFPSKTNKILREILSLTFDNESENRYDRIIMILKKYYKIDYCTIVSFEEENNILASNVHELYHDDLKKHIAEKINIKDGDAEINTARNGTLFYSSAPERNISYSYLIPLKGSKNTNGALFIENIAPFKYNREMFLLIVETINIVVQNIKANEKILDLAMKDQLTQVYNRNYMQKHLKEKIDQGTTFSLVLGDIDFFKKINDTYGHLAGDEVLKVISKILKSNLSKKDRIYRYGGEEFLIYLEGMTEIESLALVSKIKNDIEAATIISDDITLRVTMSFGCYETVSGESMKAVIEKADEALYSSKENGRNRVTMYRQMKKEKAIK